MDTITVDSRGLYCEAGGFHIDPWRSVPLAIITHAHADHYCRGCGRYLTATPGCTVLRARLGTGAVIETIDYSTPLTIGDARVSLHPAGHLLGSSQVRVEVAGRVTVFSGDYKRGVDPTCDPFEPIRCHEFISESTFGLPIYRWPDPQKEVESIIKWWHGNRADGRCSILYVYALGKAQRILAELRAFDLPGPIIAHGAVESMNEAYRAGGVELPATAAVSSFDRGDDRSAALVVAPPSSAGSLWIRRCGAASTAIASGWMTVRGMRRRRAVDRGFIISDHADWNELLHSIAETGAERVRLTHGYSAALARYLSEHGRDVDAPATRFQGEDATDEAVTETAE